MKRKFLLLIACCISATTWAQERTVAIMGHSAPDNKSYASLKAIKAEREAGRAHKTTAADPRWFSYAEYFDTTETLTAGEPALFGQYLWNDTMAIMAYGSSTATEWRHNRMVSMGLIIDPAFSGFNDAALFPGLMKVTSSDAITVDSIRFYGNYGFSPDNTGFVDTLRVTFGYAVGDVKTDDVYLAKTGNPLVLSRYGVSAGDSMHTYRMHYDTVTNTPSGINIVTKDILLDNNGTTPAWADTLPNGMYEAKLQLAAGGIAVGANKLLGATVTFISGDPSFVAHDTVFGTTMGYKYNMFRPYTLSRWDGTAYGFPSYSVTDRNNGIFKSLPDTANGWGGQYIPQWFWSSTGGTASSLQYPVMEFHVVCATCGIIEVGVDEVSNIIKTSAYPNPATDEVIVPFTLNDNADVTVSLSNMLGQQVAIQEHNNVLQGKATFKTSHLPAGMYMYTVSANGRKSSGRVSVMH